MTKPEYLLKFEDKAFKVAASQLNRDNWDLANTSAHFNLLWQTAQILEEWYDDYLNEHV